MGTERIHVFSSIWLHFNWHCQENRPLIKRSLEQELHGFITNYVQDMKGFYLDCIGGTETHIHLVARMDPSIAPKQLPQMVKGASAFEMNRRWGTGALVWQRGYGVVSFAERNLPGIRSYVANQKEHHGTDRSRLKSMLEECCLFDDED